MVRIIGHVDMDAFFASVEERDHEWLKGAPIVVGADPQGGEGRGVVSTANYAARKYGIHSAMPINKAWRLAENAKRRGEQPAYFLTPNFARYQKTHDAVMAILRAASPLVEEASIDEAYIDLSFCRDYAKAATVCRTIKQTIKKNQQLTCSIGIGPNKFIAKIASDVHKPDGMTIVRPEEVKDFLSPQPVRVIPGIGPKAEGRLRAHRIITINDARAHKREDLVDWFGSLGKMLYDRVRGVDARDLVSQHDIKSIGEQETFHTDTRDSHLLLSTLSELSRHVQERLAKSPFSSFRTVVVTVRFGDFQTQSRSHTAAKPLTSYSDLDTEALKLFMPFLDARENPHKKQVRLLGVRIEKLS